MIRLRHTQQQMQAPNLRVLQPTLQVALALFLTMLLTFIRPINFSLACLSSVFVLVLHILLVQNHHVGTQLISAASLLGTVWSGIATAGIVVTICMQIPSRAGHIALLVVLASGCFALGCLVRVSARGYPLLFLQGTNLLMTFGMSVVLSFWAPTVNVLWSSYLAHMLLAFTAAGLASVVSGLLVLPSLATAEALSNVITALNRAGQTSTMCISILLAPLHLLGPAKPGDPKPHPVPWDLQPQPQPQTASTPIGSAANAVDSTAALGGAADASSGQAGRVLQQQPSLLLEEPVSASQMSSFVEQSTQPGQWGLRSFLAANTAGGWDAQQDRQAGGSSNTAAEAAATGRSAAHTAAANALPPPQQQQQQQQLSPAPSAALLCHKRAAAQDHQTSNVQTPLVMQDTSGAVQPPATAAAAAPVGAGGNGSASAAVAATSSMVSVSATAAFDEDNWGHDHWEDDQYEDLASADANVQLSSTTAGFGGGNTTAGLSGVDSIATTETGPGLESSSGPVRSCSSNSSSTTTTTVTSTTTAASLTDTAQPQSLQMSTAAVHRQSLLGPSGKQNREVSSGRVCAAAAPPGSTAALHAAPAEAAAAVAARLAATQPAQQLAAAGGQLHSPLQDALSTNSANSKHSPSLSAVHYYHQHHHHDHSHHKHQQHHQPQQKDSEKGGSAQGSKPSSAAAAAPAAALRMSPELQRHPLIRLQRGVDQIRPLLQATRQLQYAVAVEQAWWVGLLVRYSVRPVVQPGAWQTLVDALEALVHRFAALESMLEGGHDYSSLAQLTSYQPLAATCGALFAQAAALCAVLSSQLRVKLQQTQQQGDVLCALQQLAAAVCGSSGSSGKQHATQLSGSLGHAGGDAAKGSTGLLGSQGSTDHISSSSSRKVPHTTTTAAVAAAGAAPHHHHMMTGPAAAPSHSSSTSSHINSNDQPPALKPALCSASCFDWGLAKQHLVGVLEFETQQYYTALVQAAHDRPFKLDPARSITALMFLCTLCLGVIEACQKLQAAAQAVLGGSAGGSAVHDRDTAQLLQPHQQQQQQQALMQSAEVGVVQREHQQRMAAGAPAGPDAAVAAVLGRRPAGSGVGTGATAAVNIHHPQQQQQQQQQQQRQQQGGSGGDGVSSTWLLLRVFLMVEAGKRIWDALAHQLPAACKSRAAFKAQLSDRRFQAGFKAWLAGTVALVVIAAAYTSLLFLGRQGASIFMFGFMSLVFTMRERVESSMEMVMFRVGATVVGGCLGHLVMFHPATAYNPYILGALNIFFTLLLVPFSMGQFRLVVVLALLTFTSVTMCQYVGCCGGVGSITYLVGRILATGGGSLFAMLLNRMLWPWRRNRWAMEELSRALGIAVVAATKMYHAEYQHLSAATPAPTPAAASSRRSSQNQDQHPQQQQQQLGQHGDVIVSIHRPKDSCASSACQQQQQQQQQQLVSSHQATGPCSMAAKAAEATSKAAAAGARGGSAPAGAAAAAMIAGDPSLVTKSPEELQQVLGSLLMPVQVSIARDTWIVWKKGTLAVTPSVPLMMMAVQQLLDALLALGITYKQLSTQHLPAQQTGQAPTTPDNSYGAHSSISSRSPAECMQWQQQLLLHELVQPIHGSFCKLLGELAGLVALVQQHVRRPTEGSRAALLTKIQEVHDLRVSVSLEYIQLSNQRHRKMRQQLATLWHHQQQTQPQQQQQQQQHLPILPWSGRSSGVTVDAGDAWARSSTVTAEPVDVASQQLEAGSPADPTASNRQQAGEQPAEGLGPATAAAGGAGWCVQQPGFQHQVLSTVQYMAFVHAMRRFFDRAVAVARCAADAKF